MKSSRIILIIALVCILSLTLVLAACNNENKHEHTFGEWITDIEPTYYTEGKEHAVCSICGYTEERVKVFDEVNHKHSFNEWITDSEPTFEKDGLEHSICTTCGYRDERALEYDLSHTIVFYSTQGSALQYITNFAIKEFEEKYPDWEVKHVSVGRYNDLNNKISDDFTTNKQPDIAYCYADNVAKYIISGKVVDLNTLINSTDTVTATIVNDFGIKVNQDVTVGFTVEEINDFIPALYNEGKASNFGDYDKYGYSANDMLSLPFVKSTEVMYYNSDLLIELGFYTEINDVKVATPAQTWDELWEQCAIIKALNPNMIPFAYDSESNWFVTMCEQNNWAYTQTQSPNLLFNNDYTKAWLQQMGDYYKKGYFTTMHDYGVYTSNIFTAGRCVYSIGSANGASNYSTNSFTCGVAPVPGSKSEDGTIKNAVICQGPSFVMLSNGNGDETISEKQKMTFLFMKELLDPTFQAMFAIQSGCLPNRLSSYTNEMFLEYISDTTKISAVATLISMLEAENFFTLPAFVGSDNIHSKIAEAFVDVIQGKKTPEQALSEIINNHF